MSNQPQPPPPYYPQGYGYPPQQTKTAYPEPPPAPQQSSQTTNTVVVTNAPSTVVAPVLFRSMPVNCTCPKCGATIITSTSYEAGSYAWLMMFIICILGFWAGCCLIPLFLDGCKDVVHSCPNCRMTIHRWNRM